MMFKRLLIVSALLLMLVVGFLLVPTRAAHADTCNGPCGADPVAAGCVNGQYIINPNNPSNFMYGTSTWQIRLRSSTHCPGKVWASLVLVSGSNGISNASDIEVFSASDTQVKYDILYASKFYDGAYTNMIVDLGQTCAYYDGEYVHPTYPNHCE